jgi:tRNA G18 (ribose-2'-O)-methylase SpoU
LNVSVAFGIIVFAYFHQFYSLYESL